MWPTYWCTLVEKVPMGLTFGEKKKQTFVVDNFTSLLSSSEKALEENLFIRIIHCDLAIVIHGQKIHK